MEPIPGLRHRHDRDRNRNHDLPYRYGYGQVRSSEIRKAERKAEKEKREQAEQAIAILGLALLGKLLDAMKPDAPVQSPSKQPDRNIIPDTDITDAEYVDIVEEPETKALVIRS